MKIKDYLLQEEYFAVLKDYHGEAFTVYRNPNLKEVIKSAKPFGCRFTIDFKRKDLYVWPVDKGTHSTIINRCKMPFDYYDIEIFHGVAVILENYKLRIHSSDAISTLDRTLFDSCNKMLDNISDDSWTKKYFVEAASVTFRKMLDIQKQRLR